MPTPDCVGACYTPRDIACAERRATAFVVSTVAILSLWMAALAAVERGAEAPIKAPS